MIFFSTSRDQIHRVQQLPDGVANNNTGSVQRSMAGSGSTMVYTAATAGGGSSAISGSGLGGGLAVDWLNNQLYFSEDNKVGD
jgi:hypothetical protein